MNFILKCQGHCGTPDKTHILDIVVIAINSIRDVSSVSVWVSYTFDCIVFIFFGKPF